MLPIFVTKYILTDYVGGCKEGEYDPANVYIC